ncbi:hypothetical protein HNR60_000895 [Rhodopseudomonas rhenobacensis]|uniref:DNA-binding protein n=1 Tax=Rhodopseudomonas rhenobacensis TaxID=87461 RepID=A0A7W7Z1F3_9BRAD|nr:hypothetical protein [Rhodopseudomonas rhenobacensis]MBB5046153.1 hypothetical protein [Rhodopseudomonas rhenobacensis]
MNEAEKPSSEGTPPACLPAHLDKPRLRREHASEYLDVVFGITIAPATLAKYVTIGGGPEFQKVNRTPLYPRHSLDAWAKKKLGPLIASSSQAG